MSIYEIILLSIALAMDCFTVSITCGLIQKRIDFRTVSVTSFMFGLFQALMPVIGWFCIFHFSEYITRLDHWIAFGLLGFLGTRMIIEGLKDEDEEKNFDPTRIGTTITMAIATSIDALAVGLSFGCTGMVTFGSILLPVVIIGIGSMLFSVAGFFIGVYAGKKFSFPVEIIAGIILIGIGLKILVEHLFFLN